MSCNKCSNQKTATNNQWAATTAGKLSDHKEKTEFSNEWISTNKVIDIEDVDN